VRPRYASALLRAGLGTVANETDAAIVPFRKPA